MSNKQAIPSGGRPFRLWTVLDKMIISDLLKTVSSVLLVLVIIIVSQKFIRVLAQAIEGNIANETVLSLLGFKIIIVASTFLPAALFMSVLMVLGRMYRDQEMAAIASAGGGMLTLYRSVFWVLIPLSFCAAGLSMYATPWAEAQSQKMMHNDAESADIRSIAPGRFSEYRSGELIFYAEVLDASGKMRNVFVQNKQGQRLGIANAEYGHIDNLPGGAYLILEHGERIQGVPGNKDFSIEKFDEYAVLIERKTTDLVPNKHSIESQQLIQSADLLDITELQDRLNSPLGVILLGFLAVPLSRISPRGGVYGNLLVAFGIYFAYSNLQRVNHSWMLSGKISPLLGYVWIDALLLLLGFGLLIRFYGFKWLLANLRKGH